MWKKNDKAGHCRKIKGRERTKKYKDLQRTVQHKGTVRPRAGHHKGMVGHCKAKG